MWLLVPQQPHGTGRWSWAGLGWAGLSQDGLGWAQRQPCGFVALSHGVGPRPLLQLVSLPWASAGPRLQRVTVTGWWQLVAAGAEGHRFGLREPGGASSGLLLDQFHQNSDQLDQNVTLSSPLFKRPAPWSR